MVAGGIVAAVFILHAGAGGAGAAQLHPPVPAPAQVATPHVDVATGYTQRTWALALLGALKVKATACTLGLMLAWETAESGPGSTWGHRTGKARDDDPARTRNPLNTTRTLDPAGASLGGRAINGAGVRKYPTWRAGFTGTLAALLDNGFHLYDRVLADLRASMPAQQTANDIVASKWGTHPFLAACQE
jgi:hypothetical protein